MLTSADVDALTAQLRHWGITTDVQLRWAAAVGGVQLLFRRSNGGVWEQWHGTPWGLGDGEMMRANCAMTRLVHAHIDPAGTPWMTVAAELTDPARTLPDGRTLREYAGRRLPTLHRDVHAAAETLTSRQLQAGPRAALVATASMTGIWGNRWYGMPAWPLVVEKFCAAADNPQHPHWHGETPPPRPASIADTSRLRELMLAGPDHLDAETAVWCIRAHLPYVTLPTDR